MRSTGKSVPSLLTGLLLFSLALLAVSCGPEQTSEKKGRNNPHPPMNRRAVKLMDSAQYLVRNNIYDKQVEALLLNALEIQVADSNAYGEALTGFYLARYYAVASKNEGFGPLDRAFWICAKEGYDSLMIELYLFRGRQYSHSQQQESDFIRADSLAKLHNYQERRIFIFQEKALNCFYNDDPHRYRDCIDSAITLMLSLGMKKPAATALENLSDYTENRMQNINVAADKLEKAVAIYREGNDSLALARCLGHLGFLQGGQRVYGESWKNMREGIAILERYRKNDAAADTRMNLALVYEKSSQPDSALAQLDRAVKTWKELDNAARQLEAMNDAIRVCMTYKKAEEGRRRQKEAEAFESSNKNMGWEQRLEFLRISSRFFRAIDENEKANKYAADARAYEDNLKNDGVNTNASQ